MPKIPRIHEATTKEKTSMEFVSIREINKKIEIFKKEKGHYPKYPNMEDMFFNEKYFPDGPPRDPFTNKNKIGTYKMDLKTKKISLKEHNPSAKGHELMDKDYFCKYIVRDFNKCKEYLK
ncbi:hypothetical protein M1437_02500 [Patescibacteria group bacterium]|nr:hypothetical protein [Patescibacteria group bacterium]